MNPLTLWRRWRVRRDVDRALRAVAVAEQKIEAAGSPPVPPPRRRPSVRWEAPAVVSIVPSRRDDEGPA